DGAWKPPSLSEAARSTGVASVDRVDSQWSCGPGSPHPMGGHAVGPGRHGFASSLTYGPACSGRSGAACDILLMPSGTWGPGRTGPGVPGQRAPGSTYGTRPLVTAR